MKHNIITDAHNNTFNLPNIIIQHLLKGSLHYLLYKQKTLYFKYLPHLNTDTILNEMIKK